MARTWRISSMKCSSASTATAPVSSRGAAAAGASRGSALRALPPVAAPGPSWRVFTSKPGQVWHWRASTIRQAPSSPPSPARRGLPHPPLRHRLLRASKSPLRRVQCRCSKPYEAHHSLDCASWRCSGGADGRSPTSIATATQSRTPATPVLLSSLMPSLSSATRRESVLGFKLRSYASQARTRVSGRETSQRIMRPSANPSSPKF
mmetsp:Transcript_9252/g.25915  ORF Transcript_9252/g.25915 Transcript_9252/m.25915 type:complete len:206 (+) Transcript_9252:140-757(+)